MRMRIDFFNSSRRGLYEIIMAFFLIVVLIFAVIFFVFMNAASAQQYAGLKKIIGGPQDAVLLKDALLACHRIDYLTAEKFEEPGLMEACDATEMLRGFRVVQLPMNGCQRKVWDYSKEGYNQLVPFVVAVEQPDGSRKCLAQLEVYLV